MSYERCILFIVPLISNCPGDAGTLFSGENFNCSRNRMNFTYIDIFFQF